MKKNTRIYELIMKQVRHTPKYTQEIEKVYRIYTLRVIQANILIKS